MKILKIVFDAVWLLGWLAGGAALLDSHWYITIGMWILAPLPAGYDLYKAVCLFR